MDLVSQIDALWENDELDPTPIEQTIRLLDQGEVRVAEKRDGEWLVNEWTKKAILLYFRLRKVEPMEVGGLHFLDKIPVKADYAERGVRVVPQVALSASVPIIDVTGPRPVEHRGYVPPRSVVLPGTRSKNYPAGRYELPCALIVGERSASTDLKTSLNDVLREFEIGA